MASIQTLLSSNLGGSRAQEAKTKQEFVAGYLREAILSGQLLPGKRLRQQEVARRLGVSWTPVREAFRQLEGEGWLVFEGHRGGRITPLSLEDFEDIYLLRLANEPPIARLSAERIDNETLAKMENLAAQIKAIGTSRNPNWVTFLKLERELHATQYRMAGRQRLYELVMSLRDTADRYLRASMVVGDEPSQHQLAHDELLAACRARDGAAAEATMRRALDRVLARVRPLLVQVLNTETSNSNAQRPLE